MWSLFRKDAPRFRVTSACGLGLFISLSPATLPAQEQISAFTLTGIEGNLAARYIFDENLRSQSGSPPTFQERPTYEQELNIMTHSYVYHPNLLDVDMGGGVLFSQQDFESNEGNSSSENDLYNFNARLNFLKEKDYPFTLYYDRSNPSVSTSQLGRFQVENTRYGMNAALREPFLPLTLTLDSFHFESNGSGFDTIVDQITDQTTIGAQKTYGNGDSIKLNLLTNDTRSGGGSPGLPIQKTRNDSKTATVNAVNYFGDTRQITLTQLFTRTDQDLEQESAADTESQDTRYNADMRWFHDIDKRSFYQFRHNDSTHSNINTTSDAATMGFAYEPREGFQGDIDVHGDTETQNSYNLERTRYGILTRIGYKREIDDGSFHIGGSVQQDTHDQSSDLGTAQVVDESITLTATDAVALRSDFIDTTSLVITNESRTQTFVENIDYRVIVIGSTTEIERLIGGNILDGEVVLASYQYQTGGTFSFDTLAYSINMNLRMWRYYKFYAQYRDYTQSVNSGQPTIQLNSSSSVLVGASTDYPFLSGWTVGGEISMENHDEDISPYTREKLVAYSEAVLPSASRLRLTGRREQVDNENSNEDVDLSQVIMNFSSRPWLRTRVLLEASYEKDTGSSLERRRNTESIGLEWRFRRLMFSVVAESVDERQGTLKIEQSHILAQLMRTF